MYDINANIKYSILFRNIDVLHKYVEAA